MWTRKSIALLAVSASALFAAPIASAVPPSLLSVTVQDRHAAITFTAPRADFGSIYFATRPDRATDGEFLTENVKHLDVLTDSELQSGRWSDESQLDPGTYWVMLRVSPDFDACWIYDAGAYDPACASGFSNLVQLTVPRPTVRYAARVTVYRFLREVTLAVTATPLGDNVPYRVCARITPRRVRCVRGTLEGFSWGSSASDSVDMSTRGLPRTTTFTWMAEGRTIATRRVRLR